MRGLRGCSPAARQRRSQHGRCRRRPGTSKEREEAKADIAKVVSPTFEECAEAYIRANWSHWSKKHRDQWPSSLKRYPYATIGKLPIPEIKPSHIYDLLDPIWVEKEGDREPRPRPN
jgi:hypothetical protein